MLKIDNFGDDYYVSFNGINRLNINNAGIIKNELVPIVMITKNNLSLDFGGINFVDSSAFQVLVALLKIADLYGSKLEIINVSDDLKELFDLLSLSDVFEIAAN